MLKTKTHRHRSTVATACSYFRLLAYRHFLQLNAISEDSSISLYLVSERSTLNKPLSELITLELPTSVGIFPMVANPKIGAAEADRPWRDIHAPHALEVHDAMTLYHQLSVAHRFFGPA